MPSVYTFSHSDSELLAELLKVLGPSGGSFREQWSLQAEAVVEPVGWEALWKLSKEFCQKLGVRFPCVAYVCVQGVNWDGLSVSLEVRGVQHELVQLPSQRDDVPLIELWPTRRQSEPCVDAQSTAEFINLLRFYYNNIWMPWDDLEERVMLPATLEERMKLWAGAHDGTIPKHVTRRITLLRNDALATYRKIRETEEMVGPDELNDDDDSMLPDIYMSRCAEMYARLDYLLSKWTTFENPLIRSSYLAEHEKDNKDNYRSVNILWKGGSVRELQQLVEELSQQLSAEQRVCVCWSAEEALAAEPSQLLVCSTDLNLPDIPLADVVVRGIGNPTVTSSEVRSCLLVVTGDTELRDLTLHCRQANTAVLVRHGTLRISRCRITDDSVNYQSDFVQGVVVMAGAALLLESCQLDNLYSGLVVHSGAQVEMRDCTMSHCGVGVQMFSGSKVKIMKGTTIVECAEQSLRYELELDDDDKRDISEASLAGLTISPCCKIGSGNESDICIVQQESGLV